MNSLYPWTCTACNSAGDILLSGDGAQRLEQLIREHVRVSPGCEEPVLMLVDQGQVVRIPSSESESPLFDVKAHAAYPD